MRGEKQRAERRESEKDRERGDERRIWGLPEREREGERERVI